MNTDNNWYWNIIDELDAMPQNVTEWEADFLESIISRQGYKLTSRQKKVIEKMKEKYLA